MGPRTSSSAPLLALLTASVASASCVSRDLSPERFACRTGGPCDTDAGRGDAPLEPDDATSSPDPDGGTTPADDALAPTDDATAPADDATTPPPDSGTPAELPWWGGRARVPVTLTASSGLAATDAISLVIDHAQWVRAGLSRIDGDDLRVVRWDGTQWVERDRILDPGSDWGVADTRLWITPGLDLPAGAVDTSTYLYLGDSPPTPEAPADPAQVFLFHDDFERGTAAAWTEVRESNGAITVQGATTHRGRFALSARVEQGQGWASVQHRGFAWPSAITTLWLWLPLDHTAQDTIPAFYCGPNCDFAAPFGQIAGFGLNVTAPLVLSYDLDGTFRFDAAAAPVTLGQWHRVELRTRADPVAGRSEVWIDGAPVASLSGIDTRAQLERLDVGLFWKNDGATAATIFADDVFVRPWIASDPSITLGPLVRR